MRNILIIIALFLLVSCEIYAVVDLNEPIIVEQKVSQDRYRVGYYYNNQHYFMEIITNQNLQVGDKLKLIK